MSDKEPGKKEVMWMMYAHKGMDAANGEAVEDANNKEMHQLHQIILAICGQYCQPYGLRHPTVSVAILDCNLECQKVDKIVELGHG